MVRERGDYLKLVPVQKHSHEMSGEGKIENLESGKNIPHALKGWEN